ncbi:MAG: hypothetical protein HQL20_08175 [Candidatus Omnitrophica bacterium]|nr:hypothetical protein [Candidatus Omnitrophota bacterium]
MARSRRSLPAALGKEVLDIVVNDRGTLEQIIRMRKRAGLSDWDAYLGEISGRFPDTQSLRDIIAVPAEEEVEVDLVQWPKGITPAFAGFIISDDQGFRVLDKDLRPVGESNAGIGRKVEVHVLEEKQGVVLVGDKGIQVLDADLKPNGAPVLYVQDTLRYEQVARSFFELPKGVVVIGGKQLYLFDNKLKPVILKEDQHFSIANVNEIRHKGKLKGLVFRDDPNILHIIDVNLKIHFVHSIREAIEVLSYDDGIVLVGEYTKIFLGSDLVPLGRQIISRFAGRPVITPWGVVIPTERGFSCYDRQLNPIGADITTVGKAAQVVITSQGVVVYGSNGAVVLGSDLRPWQSSHLDPILRGAGIQVFKRSIAVRDRINGTVTFFTPDLEKQLFSYSGLRGEVSIYEADFGVLIHSENGLVIADKEWKTVREENAGDLKRQGDGLIWFEAGVTGNAVAPDEDLPFWQPVPGKGERRGYQETDGIVFGDRLELLMPESGRSSLSVMTANRVKGIHPTPHGIVLLEERGVGFIKPDGTYRHLGVSTAEFNRITSLYGESGLGQSVQSSEEGLILFKPGYPEVPLIVFDALADEWRKFNIGKVLSVKREAWGAVVETDNRVYLYDRQWQEIRRIERLIPNDGLAFVARYKGVRILVEPKVDIIEHYSGRSSRVDYSALADGVMNQDNSGFVAEERAPDGLANGGIDLTTSSAEVLAAGGAGAAFTFDPAMLRELQDASGLVPAIINIRSLDNVPAFLNAAAPGASGA